MDEMALYLAFFIFLQHYQQHQHQRLRRYFSLAPDEV
jgi:hypothetical protein